MKEVKKIIINYKGNLTSKPCCLNCNSSGLLVKMTTLEFYACENTIGQIQFCRGCLDNPRILNSKVIQMRISPSLPGIAIAIVAAIENLKKGFVFKGFENNGD